MAGATSTPAGIDDRIATLQDTITARDDWTFDELVDFDNHTTSQDFRARHFLPMLLELRGDRELNATARAALDLLADLGRLGKRARGGHALRRVRRRGRGRHRRRRPDLLRPGQWAGFVDNLFGDLRAPTYTVDGQAHTFNLVGRQLEAGRHVYDMTPPLHVALRTLDPSTSSLGTAMDYARGRSRRQVLRDVVQATTDALVAEQGADAAAWRQAYTNPGDNVCSPTGMIRPCGTMPFIERGTWIHDVGWPAPGASGTRPRHADGPADDSGHGVRAAPLPATRASAQGLALAMLAGAGARAATPSGRQGRQ